MIEILMIILVMLFFVGVVMFFINLIENDNKIFIWAIVINVINIINIIYQILNIIRKI